MELHPFLENGVLPRSGIWYVCPTESGEPPSMRVGHAAVAKTPDLKLDPSDCNNALSSTVYFLGGANPDGAFSEVFMFSLDTFCWDMHPLDDQLQLARYEHAMWSPSRDYLAVFGGATSSRNLSDVQLFQLDEKQALRSVTVRHDAAPAPSARTQHSAAFCPNSGFLYVFGGGHAGTQPVQDRQLHRLQLSVDGVARWTKMDVTGNPPTARHGHVMALTATGRLYIHGGMQGVTFYGDLHYVDLHNSDAVGGGKPKWHQTQFNRGHVRPCARSGHGGVVCGSKFYIFGGMNEQGQALQDFYYYHKDTAQWTQVVLLGASPTPRLDFAYCLARLRRRTCSFQHSEDELELGENKRDLDLRDLSRLSDTASHAFDKNDCAAASLGVLECEKLAAAAAAASCSEECRQRKLLSPCRTILHDVPVFLIHGGMDTEGLIFDDTLLILLEDD